MTALIFILVISALALVAAVLAIIAAVRNPPQFGIYGYPRRHDLCGLPLTESYCPECGATNPLEVTTVGDDRPVYVCRICPTRWQLPIDQATQP